MPTTLFGYTLREAATILQKRGIKTSKSALHREMPILVASGLVSKRMYLGATTPFEISEEQLDGLERYFKDSQGRARQRRNWAESKRAAQKVTREQALKPRRLLHQRGRGSIRLVLDLLSMAAGLLEESLAQRPSSGRGLEDEEPTVYPI